MNTLAQYQQFSQAPRVNPYTFTIYTNDYLTATTDEEIEAAVAITFGCVMDFEYKNEVKVAYEPLENSQFSSDSVQDTPYLLTVTGALSPQATVNTKRSIFGFNTTDLGIGSVTNQSQVNNYGQFADPIEDVLNNLQSFLQNTTLLTIIKRRPIFTQYTNLKLTSYNYKINTARTYLAAVMTFQEVRQTTTQYGGLLESQVANPQNASAVDTGTKSPTLADVPGLGSVI